MRYTLLLLLVIFTGCISQQKRFDEWKNFDKTLTTLEYYGLSGGMMVVKNDKIEYLKSFGFSDYENSAKNSIDTRFDLGSVTKHITAVAILKLEQEGIVNINDPIGKYISISDSIKKGITIQQLLNHTSGLEKDPKYETKDDFVLSKDIPKILSQTKLKSSPGEKFRYSNFGYSVLALIIEIASKSDYQAYIQNTFFRPLEMTQTSFYDPDISENFSFGYQRFDFSRERVHPYDYTDIPLWMCGASGVVSSFKDMNTWFSALFNKKILNENQLQKFLTPVGVASKLDNPYANGIRIVEKEGNNTVYHDGDTSGHEIKMMYFMDSGYLFLFYVNNRDRWRGVMEHMIDNFMNTHKIVELPEPLAETDIAFSENKKSKDFEVKIHNNKPYIVALTQKSLFQLTDLNISAKQAELLNENARILAESIIKTDTLAFRTFIDTTKYSSKERLQKVASNFGNIHYDSFEVMGTSVWKPGVNQTFIKFTKDDNFIVLRFVWHPKKNIFLFFGSGNNYLAVRELFYTKDSTFYSYHPKDRYFRSITIGDRILVKKDSTLMMR